MDETRASILIAQAESDSPLATHLIREGYRVEQAYYARPFLIDFSRMKPNLIVLDSALPGGDAFTLCARIREQDHVAILMLIDNDETSIERAFRMGATDVLFKPVSITLLCYRVRSLLENQQHHAQTRAYETRWQQTFELRKTSI